MDPLLCPLFKWSQEDPSHPCIVTQKKTWSYAEIDALVEGTCAELIQYPLKQLAFIATPSLHTILSLLASFRLGLIACPLSPKLPLEQIPHALSLLGLPSCFDIHQLAIQPLPSKKTPFLNREALATFLFTSGSSGQPKIACHSLNNHYLSALGLLDPLQLSPTARYHLSLPLYHVSGLAILFRTLIAGATLILSPSPLELSPSHISLVPTQLYRFMQQRDLPPLTCLLIGGAPLSESLRKEALLRHLPLVESYGMTEMSSTVTLGTVLPYRELKIHSGEIYVRGETLFQGYWDVSCQQCTRPLDPEGWLPTRDLGAWDSQGQLRFLGRKDRLFFSGGENIQPEEIEHALCLIPGIVNATVIPIPDPEWGSRPVAFIEDTSHAHTASSLYLSLAPLLPAFKRPVHVYPYPLGTEGTKLSVDQLYSSLSV